MISVISHCGWKYSTRANRLAMPFLLIDPTLSATWLIQSLFWDYILSSLCCLMHKNEVLEKEQVDKDLLCNFSRFLKFSWSSIFFKHLRWIFMHNIKGKDSLCHVKKEGPTRLIRKKRRNCTSSKNRYNFSMIAFMLLDNIISWRKFSLYGF